MEEIVRSDEYEAPALEWLYQQTVQLNGSLRVNGAVDEAVRRKICEEVMFGMGYVFDQEEVDAGERTYKPMVGFAEGGRVLLPLNFDFHDFAHGVVGEVFGDS